MFKLGKTLQFFHLGYFSQVLDQRLLSVLNLSHASFSVLNTVPAIIRTSVFASCAIYEAGTSARLFLV